MPADRSDLREIYVETLCKLAKERADFVVLDADSKEATKVDRFARLFPDRALSFGIAEQNMVSAAAGFATTGIIPFVNTYAMFIAMRALDQVRNSVAYPNLNVKLVVSHFGLDVGSDGVTHQVIEDLAIMRALPNMIVVSPADDLEMAAATRFALQHQGPVYLRTGKSRVARVHKPGYEYQLGRPPVLIMGTDVTIFAVGVMVERALRAASEIRKEGISVLVANCSTLKPVDEEVIVSLACRTGAVVTAEDHNQYGGLGGLIAEVLSRHCPVPIEMVAVADRYGEAGTPKQLFERYGLSEAYIMQAVQRVLERKR